MMWSAIWAALVKAAELIAGLWGKIPEQQKRDAIETASRIFQDYLGRKYDEYMAAKAETKAEAK